MFQVRQLFSSIQSSIQVSNRFPQHVSSCAYLPQASSQQIRFLVGSSSSYHAAMAFMQAQGFKVAQCVLIHFCLSRSDPRMSASLLAPGSQLLQPGCRLLQLRLSPMAQHKVCFKLGNCSVQFRVQFKSAIGSPSMLAVVHTCPKLQANR